MRRSVVAVVILVVLAGCTTAVTPPGVQDGTDGSTADRITVKNGTLPVDADALYLEVTGLRGVTVSKPATIDVEPDEQMGIGSEPMPPFFRLVGIQRPEGADRAATALGYVADGETVHINEKLLDDPERLEATLVHEYVHIIQGKVGAFHDLDDGVADATTTDGQVVKRSILEGGAVMVGNEYWQRNDGSGSSPVAEMASSYRSTNGARQWVFASYYFGHRYVDARTDSVTEIGGVYRNPPRTSEELIHALPPGSEPVRPLNVSIDEPGWQTVEEDTTGELFVRVALDTTLSAETAADAAAGWGNDEQVTIAGNDETAYVWALRWDDTENATEFESAFRDHLDQRGTAVDGIWLDDGSAYSVTRVSPETVVVVIGDEATVRSLSVSGTNDDVIVGA